MVPQKVVLHVANTLIHFILLWWNIHNINKRYLIFKTHTNYYKTMHIAILLKDFFFYKRTLELCISILSFQELVTYRWQWHYFTLQTKTINFLSARRIVHHIGGTGTACCRVLLCGTAGAGGVVLGRRRYAVPWRGAACGAGGLCPSRVPSVWTACTHITS